MNKNIFIFNLTYYINTVLNCFVVTVEGSLYFNISHSRVSTAKLAGFNPSCITSFKFLISVYFNSKIIPPKTFTTINHYTCHSLCQNPFYQLFF